jgi:hypothetical protein
MTSYISGFTDTHSIIPDFIKTLEDLNVFYSPEYHYERIGDDITITLINEICEPILETHEKLLHFLRHKNFKPALEGIIKDMKLKGWSIYSSIKELQINMRDGSDCIKDVNSMRSFFLKTEEGLSDLELFDKTTCYESYGEEIDTYHDTRFLRQATYMRPHQIGNAFYGIYFICYIKKENVAIPIDCEKYFISQDEKIIIHKVVFKKLSEEYL